MKSLACTMVHDSVTHYVTLNDHRGDISEQVMITFTSAWRGKPATVRMEASRYTHSSGLSEWRIFAERVREGMHDAPSGIQLSDTARRQLGDACEPAVKAWLATTAYKASRVVGLVAAIKRKLHDLRPYSDEPTREVRRLIDQYAAELETVPGTLTRLCAMASAYDAFAAVYNQEV
jgi:hypothetical protein